MLYHHHIESVSFGPIQLPCQAAADTGQALGSSVFEGKDDLDSTVASIAARLMDGCSPGGFTDFRSSFCEPGDKYFKLADLDLGHIKMVHGSKTWNKFFPV